MAGRASLTASLNALELVSEGAAQAHRAAGKPDSAVALLVIAENITLIALEMAVALRAAVAGDLHPAHHAIDTLALTEIQSATPDQKVSHAAPTLPALDDTASGAVGCADDSHPSEAA
ncbi:hypothetical protein [Sphingomonas abaci]|uniref:Uncharacterized protein n=1 Tax=Sphingomonas abaci TaxID=237611 RepID=A0A7W7AJ43_9SPHN|nr:hypothetical protein [Sphingomonas abaci]MBB4617979.1 hypothetical protein [Sphingomonas abaci]